jgi:hypothetical protein
MVRHQRIIPGGGPITIGHLAQRPGVRRHTTVELADRLSEAGLVKRVVDRDGQRRVLLGLTDLAADHRTDRDDRGKRGSATRAPTARLSMKRSCQPRSFRPPFWRSPSGLSRVPRRVRRCDQRGAITHAEMSMPTVAQH